MFMVRIVGVVVRGLGCNMVPESTFHAFRHACFQRGSYIGPGHLRM